MITPNKKQNTFITPEKAASFIPIFISAGISILIISFFVVPEYFKSTKVNLELNGLIKKKNDLDNLKSQYKVINKKFEKLNSEKTKIIELVTGNTNLDTLLDKLGEIASRNNIEYLSIAPVRLIKYEENTKEKNKAQTSKSDQTIIDPLLIEGSKKYLINLTFEAEFINLLSFLRELEFQESLILINDMNLKLLSQNGNNGEINNPSEKIEVKLSTIFYGKS
tara:strand:+ start:342 stop:1007 length:666 start_codon:yes stop_codon:yes gene_type:complete